MASTKHQVDKCIVRSCVSQVPGCHSREWPKLVTYQSTLLFSSLLWSWGPSIPCLSDRVERSSICWEFCAVLLLLVNERRQLRWSEHLIRMPLRCHTVKVFYARPPERSLRGRPITRWRDYISHLALGVPQDPPGRGRVWGDECLDYPACWPVANIETQTHLIWCIRLTISNLAFKKCLHCLLQHHTI